MNRAIVAGNLGADPEFRATGSGTSVLNLRLATNERRKDGDQWVDHTEWHSVVIFGKRADALSKMLSKGSKVVVEGALRTSSWEKDGQKRYKTEIVASDIELMGSKGGQQSSRTGRPQRGSSDDSAEPAAAANEFGDVDDDDIPF